MIGFVQREYLIELVVCLALRCSEHVIAASGCRKKKKKKSSLSLLALTPPLCAASQALIVAHTAQPTPTPHFFNVWMRGPLLIVSTCALITVLYWAVSSFCPKRKVANLYAKE